MIAGIIFALSVAALVQFFLSYCRSIVVVYSNVDLSPQARELAGLDDRPIRGDEFGRLLQLIEMCPQPGDDRTELRAVRTYYSLLNLARAVGLLAPAVAAWAERERVACAYFAAVALDRRVALYGTGVI